MAYPTTPPYNSTLIAKNIRKEVTNINFDSVDVLGLNQDVYNFLVYSGQYTPWYPDPISPLAEPSILQNLVGDQLNGAQSDQLYQAQRLDNIYQWLTETNNQLQATVEQADQLVTAASNTVQALSQASNQTTNFYWVGDNFSNTTFIDTSNTTCMIDTDHGAVMLAAQSLNKITNIVPVLNSAQMAPAIPGSNLLIVDPGTAGNSTTGPIPLFEGADCSDFNNVFDSDSTTWFQVERNFIPPTQPLVQDGQAWVYQPGAPQKQVITVTNNLDWQVTVDWYNATNSTPNVSDAEFTDIGTAPLQTILPAVPSSVATDYSAHLNFNIVPVGGAQLSFISLTPFIRWNQQMSVNYITAYSGSLQIQIAQDILLSTNNQNVNVLTQQILNRTGVTSVGGLFPIPTSRVIDYLALDLSVEPIQAPYNLGHPFTAVQTETTSTQRVIFFSIVNHSTTWNRQAANSSQPTIQATYSGQNLLGSVQTTLENALNFSNQVRSTIQQTTNLVAQTANAASNLAKSVGLGSIASSLAIKAGAVGGGLLGSISTGLAAVGPAVAAVGGVIAAIDLVGALFAHSTTTQVLQTVNGYDEFLGYWAGCGLRDCSLLQVQFVSTSQIQSLALQFAGNVTQVGLFVESVIPGDWGAGTWFQYYISTDAQNWNSIQAGNGSNFNGGYQPPTPTDTFYFKAVFTGNPNDPVTSEMLNSYYFYGQPA